MPKATRRDHGRRLLHVIGRSVHGDMLFPDVDHSGLFWSELGTQAQEHGVELSAMCLLGNHYHLLLKGRPEAISTTMHRALSKLANVRNRREERRRGALVGRRYHVVAIADKMHARRCIRYVPLNPVLHKLARDPAGWRWSTHGILVGRREAPLWFDAERALRSFGFRSAQEYERFVLADTPLALPPMTEREARDHRILVMAQVGISLDEIASRTGLSARHVSRIVATSAIRTVRL